MAQPNSFRDRDYTKFVDSPTRPGKSAVEVVGNVSESTYSTRVDVVSSSVIYLGEAIPGTDASDPLWLIKKITIIGGAISILCANGSSEHNQVWNDRSSLTYV